MKNIQNFKKTSKKGQAALEFLTTYGWAFIVILVMIGALSYFGVLNPQKLLPEKCLFEQSFGCVDYYATGGTNSADLSFYLRNNLGNTVTIKSLYANVPGGSSVSCTPIPRDLKANQDTNFTCLSISGDIPANGDKARFFVNGTYKEANGKYNHSFSGEIFATLQ